MPYHHRKPVSDETRQRARDLREQMTFPERRLWLALRRKQLAGLRFLKQAPIGPYIVDFVCRERRLIVEVDGDSHAERARHDAQRTQWLMNQKYRVVRVANDDVLKNLEGVLTSIVNAAGIDVQGWLAGEVGQIPPMD